MSWARTVAGFYGTSVRTRNLRNFRMPSTQKASNLEQIVPYQLDETKQKKNNIKEPAGNLLGFTPT